MFTYVVRAHDPMFPGKPDMYLYGYGDSVTQDNKKAVFFGEEKRQAMRIEGSTQEWTRIVAEGVALLYSCEAPGRFASNRLFGKGLLTRAVQLVTKT